MNTDKEKALRKALSRAFQFGQKYWQEADSESYAANRRSVKTITKYLAFVDETVATLAVQSVEYVTDPAGEDTATDETTTFMGLSADVRRGMWAVAERAARKAWDLE